MPNFNKGNLHIIDNLTSGDKDKIAGAIQSYTEDISNNKYGLHWVRAVRNIENILFTNGRQYVNDILASRLVNSSTTGLGDLSVAAAQNIVNTIPRPTNDLLGRYIETNIALLTENRPRPRVTPKSDRDEDQTASELSELTLEYLWEALSMPQKMRDIARLVLNTGLALLEICWDPTVPRKLQVPKTEKQIDVNLPPGAIPPEIIVPREVPVLEEGRPVMQDKIEYGDIVANIVSTFQFHTPAVHYWEDLGWILKEEFVSIDSLRDKYLTVPKQQVGLTKENGWHLESLDELAEENITSLALWWWERVSEIVEGPGPSLYISSPDSWKGHVVVRTFDRAPSMKWPKGRTIITVGNKLLYDSPKKVGARAYDPRWPTRWHPYVRYRWEAQTGSIFGRSLVSKLLPKIKRVNSIDTTLIMWRRTTPVAAWIVPKGTSPVEGLWSGQPGLVMEYDARRTATAAPSPVYPPPFPTAAIQERETQIAEMEAMAGTEEVLRGQRPSGVNSGAFFSLLRRQALASRSAILQEWDESHQELGTLFLQTTIRHVKEDPRYLERIRILAREKHSRLSIDAFSGQDLSDNVIVRVDTASMALVSKEAREAKMIEVLQYLPNLVSVEDISLKYAILDELGLKKSLVPSGPDVDRARKMVSLIKQDRFDQIFVLQEDDPYIFKALLINELKSDGFIDLSGDQQAMITAYIDIYDRQIKLRELKEQQMLMAQMGMAEKMKAGRKE